MAKNKSLQNYLNVLLFYLSFFVLNSLTAQEFKVSDNLETLILKLEGKSKITFALSENNNIAIENFSCSNPQGLDLIEIKQSKSKLTFTQKDPKLKNDPISYTLKLPKTTALFITCDYGIFLGQIKTTHLKLVLKAGDLNFEEVSAEQIILKCGKGVLNGKLITSSLKLDLGYGELGSPEIYTDKAILKGGLLNFKDLVFKRCNNLTLNCGEAQGSLHVQTNTKVISKIASEINLNLIRK